ncbi:MAG: GDP-mannose 4,6-dehydratase [Flavobacteriales bacterium]|nr:GDP-mannose 4,6-dehydratase [Flavobacteriales bacterium]|tara:strand:+ start:9291 stop:10325 length:1035 start_codon:yes stop_codon:yes gene_type:complete
MKKAIITGITGQDGAYLAKLLLTKGYKVYGAYRRTSSQNFWRIEYLGIRNNPNLILVEHDLIDAASTIRMVSEIKPEEIYNLAAQSFVHASFEQPLATSMITGIGVTHLLEAIRIINKDIKFYQASTSELYGKVQEVPQKETTAFYPRSPYGVSKLYAHWMVTNYRESYDMFACSGILFNHESPLRGLDFVTRKISDGVARVSEGLQSCIELGNLDASRDWGYAPEYVDGMYKMLQHDKADSFVLATNRAYTVRQFAQFAFNVVDIEIKWEGSGISEKGIDVKTGKTIVKVNKDYFRLAEVDALIGDYSKAEKELGWIPTTKIQDMCKIMVESDINALKTNLKS